jgi:hypothetical protein
VAVGTTVDALKVSHQWNIEEEACLNWRLSSLNLGSQ